MKDRTQKKIRTRTVEKKTLGSQEKGEGVRSHTTGKGKRPRGYCYVIKVGRDLSGQGRPENVAAPGIKGAMTLQHGKSRPGMCGNGFEEDRRTQQYHL